MNSNFIKDSRHPFISTTSPSFELAVESLKEMKRSIIFDNDSPNETELVLGDNFEIQVKDGKTFVVRKQPQYPKTYKECCDIMKAEIDVFGVDYGTACDGSHYNKRLENTIMNLRELLICRDAYWKIAGEQMGLGKHWKPNWNNDLSKYYISFYNNKVDKGVINYSNKILAFPTEEMRDAFYENFKELIEECKELL